MNRRGFLERLGVGVAAVSGALLGRACPAARGVKPMALTAPTAEKIWLFRNSPPVYSRVRISAAVIETSRNAGKGAFIRALCEEQAGQMRLMSEMLDREFQR